MVPSRSVAKQSFRNPLGYGPRTSGRMKGDIVIDNKIERKLKRRECIEIKGIRQRIEFKV